MRTYIYIVFILVKKKKNNINTIIHEKRYEIKTIKRYEIVTSDVIVVRLAIEFLIHSSSGFYQIFHCVAVRCLCVVYFNCK